MKRFRDASGSPMTRRAVLLGAASVLAAPLCGSAAAADRSAPASRGTRVTVTREMLGAGVVSSGVPLPPIPPVTGSRVAPAPSWGKPLPYPVVIADRRNNRLIEVTPDQRIVWEFASPGLGLFNYPDDAHLLEDGTFLTADIRNCRVLIIDPRRNEIVTEWGRPGACRHDPPPPSPIRTA
jgi:hypothetical protein